MSYRSIAIFCCVFAVFAVLTHRSLAHLTRPPEAPEDPQRIVSLAPSITELLYALGLEDRVVGVTDYCVYPPRVADKPQVAGFSSINFEALLRVRPDLVLLPVDKIVSRVRLEQLGIPVMLLDTHSMHGFMDAVETFGRAAGRDEQAQALLTDMRMALDAAKTRAHGHPKPRVLFVVMHSNRGKGHTSEVNIIGRENFFSEMIEAAGGVNAYQGNLPFPLLSREAIIFLNPEVIIDITPPGMGANLEAMRRYWEGFSGVSAIAHDRLHIITDASATVPGPRFPQTLSLMSEAFHPAAPEEKR